MSITFPAERVLRWLADQSDQQISAVPTDVISPDDSLSVYEELVGASLIKENRTLDGSFSFMLTNEGRIEASKAKHSYRASLAQRRILEWLTIHPTSAPSGLLETEWAEDFSGSLTEQEIGQATDELKDSGYIAGTETWGGGMIRARLTSAGHQLYRSQESIDQFNQPGGAPTMSISADNYGNQTIGNQAVGSQVGSMTADMSMNVTTDDIVRALEEFRTTVQSAEVPGVSEEEKKDLIEEATKIQEKLPKRGIDWARQSIQALVTATMSGLGEGFATSLLNVLPSN
ncbi:hypothetical protein M3D57_08500 [Corynebacterium sanguinis]|uniref:Uncharacterized protein n=1 Tax=Corynebacterium sanguinis TaxID=2594913 RepID=A0A6C1TXL6_9CORY|nr:MULTISPECIES: hypothetical protein [Corynebacterium]MBA4505312.1 hypothetical protein [Corynebacterium sanguinis]MCT1415105.1 hypothetical protein [Corynebacterium sanguinis]MCT1463976.1 hypothetical protein [Corynebacterium sanguinis]MCT1556088.1 hypothetical protein [Corynebacterium sanguinis]MCT1585348.1 hypothetical protein [Corynebacterium sanguinis]